MELKHKKLLLPSFPGDSKEYEKEGNMRYSFDSRKQESKMEKGRNEERKYRKETAIIFFIAVVWRIWFLRIIFEDYLMNVLIRISIDRLISTTE